MMKLRLGQMVMMWLLVATIEPAFAVRVQWPVEDGGNGHFYEPVAAPSQLTWEEARDGARDKGGYLVTITSALENDFVHSLIAGNPDFWVMTTIPRNVTLGPYIGLFQPEPRLEEPDGGWAWVTDEPFEFNNWLPGQPNNIAGVEHFAGFFGEGLDNFADTWNDLPNQGSELGAGVPSPRAYVVEFESVSEPSSGLGILALGTLGIGSTFLRRKKG